jgi:predicted aspartyl protease
MGTSFHASTLIGPDGGRLTVDALVDTGASFTSMAEGILRELGVQPLRRVRLRLADGSSHIESLGEAVAEIDGESVQTLVVFGPEGSPATIGAYTLEGLLLGVDPVEKRLVPLEGWWA